jgi:hypothetical protein
VVYANLMLPLVLLLFAGVISRRSLLVEAKPLSKLTLYILSPALVFNSLVRSSLTGQELLGLALGTLLLILSLALVVSILGFLFRWDARLCSALKLGSVFMNVGNYSLPIILSTCGQEGLQRAVVIVVVHQVLMFSLAVYFAARSHLGAWRSVGQVFRMPTAYAAILALCWRYLPIGPPAFLMQAVGLLAQASLPVFLLLLGIQLSSILFSRRWAILGLGSFVKLAIAPLLAYLLSEWIGLDAASGRVLILAAAAPTAIVTTMLAIEFDAEPELVSSLALTTTLLSLLSVPVVVHVLGLV